MGLRMLQHSFWQDFFAFHFWILLSKVLHRYGIEIWRWWANIVCKVSQVTP